LSLPVSALYLLAAPSTSKEARDKIIERARAGESLPVAEVKRTIEHAKGRRKAAAKVPPKANSRVAQVNERVSERVREEAEKTKPLREIEKLQDQKRKLEIENLALKSEVDDLKSKSSNADEAVRETRGPRPPPNEMLVRLSAFLAGCGPSGERFVREALIEHAKQIIASGVGDIETARRVLEKFTQREVVQGEPYDANADFSRSIDEAYAEIRARVAAGGPPWRPR
jgi:gas vesicle protein